MLGFAIQLVFTLMLLFFGLYAKNHTAVSAAMFSLVGVFVWLSLILLFDQHRRERLEAQEAEAMAAEAQSSVFEESASELRVAARRLQTWYRFVLPSLSIVFGGALLALGYWRFSYVMQKGLARPGQLPASEHPGWAIAIGLIIAFVGFVFARFVAGMSKQSIWANLRGGSAYSVGAALLGLMLAVAQFIDVAGSDQGRRILVIGVPVMMMALGVEVFLNFLLDLYRPRKKGEYPRPAFDSRILAFLSAPDRIARSIGEALDYQFGFGVQETWFYRLLYRWWPGFVVAGVCIVWILSALYVVTPDQSGMVLRFGRVVRANVTPGLHLKAPWPIDKVVVPEVVERDVSGMTKVVGHTSLGVRTLQLGTPPATGKGPILWSNKHTTEEVYNICQPSLAIEKAAASLNAQFSGGLDQTEKDDQEDDADSHANHHHARDLALVAVEVPMVYSISDPMIYDQLGEPDMRDTMLRVVGQKVLTEFVSSISIDRILGADRSMLAKELKAKLQQAYDQMNPDASGKPRGAGIEILDVTVSHMHPPRELAPKFEQVVIAQQYRETKIEVAKAKQVQLLAGVAGSVDAAEKIIAAIDRYTELRDSGAPAEKVSEQELEVVRLMSNARGEAAKTLAMAQAERWNRHMHAWSDLVRYQGRVKAFTAAPLVYRADLYFDALRDSLKDSRIYLVSADIPNLHVRTDLQDKEIGVDLFTKGPDDQ